MATALEQIREQQKQSWNRFSSGWKKWDAFNMEFLQPMGKAIIELLYLKDNDYILDIATGTGEPGITIASMVPNGKVTGTDLAKDMLVIAEENASTRGIRNYEALIADACELPFEEETFNALSCRMGFMFFPDMLLAASEMYRVLKPGGRIATSVWAVPGLNTWVTTMMSVIQKHVELPSPVAGAPGMFRCATPGLIASIFSQSGFKNITEQEIKGEVDYQGFDPYWEMMMDVSAPIVAVMASADDDVKANIKAEVLTLFNSLNKEGGAKLQYGAIVISGEK